MRNQIIGHVLYPVEIDQVKGDALMHVIRTIRSAYPQTCFSVDEFATLADQTIAVIWQVATQKLLPGQGPSAMLRKIAKARLQGYETAQ